MRCHHTVDIPDKTNKKKKKNQFVLKDKELIGGGGVPRGEEGGRRGREFF